ncbi:MAG: Gfo/Idh/MocA family oxidoreductase [Phycisphaerae bacterium]|nr:Gfo/Idh/MocA family oxidoreductase [Phycisphaerae bacterium]
MNQPTEPNRRVRWGVLSTAKIGLEKVIPALQAGRQCSVTAIASRYGRKAEAAAKQLGIPKAYGSYETLLADPDVEAVYIPLPNHLHVPWSVRAIEAGKHVLCEKPIGLTSREVQDLIEVAARHPRLKVMEAFMYRLHPQWQWARRLAAEGGIGELRTIQSFFSYWNVDPRNIRNVPSMGGGGLMDIGCYCISLSRFLFDAEPRRVMGIADLDPVMGIDRMTCGVLEFDRGTSTFTCSTQLTPYQRVHVFGTEGRIEIEIPFNAPPDRPCRVWHQRRGQAAEEIVLEVCDQYTIQGDLFAKAVIEDGPVPTPLEDALENMRVIEAVLLSARQGTWV